MEQISLFLSLSLGVTIVLALFFLFYRGFKWDNKLAALLSIALVLGGYIPLAVLNWPGLDVFAIHFAFFVMTAYGLGIITSHRKLKKGLDAHLGIEQTEDEAGWFHWGPALIIAFFLILAVVDSVIITLASSGASSEFMARFLPEPRGGGKIVSAFPGAVSNDYQEKYDQFNSYLEQLVTQRERGWKIGRGWHKQPVAGQASVFSIQVTDKQEQAVSGAVVEAVFLRPGDSRLDQQLQLPEEAPGIYGKGVELAAPGRWDVLLTITRGEEVHQVKGVTQVAE